MGMDFKKVFAGGFDTATPDGQLPKLNAPGMDGIYEFEILESEGFTPSEQGKEALSFKAEVLLFAATTNKIPVGQKASVLIHGLNATKDYVKVKHWGNFKALLAAALSSLFDTEISPLDASQPWLDYADRACSIKEELKGARVRLQVNTEKSGKEKDGKEYAKLRFEALPRAPEKAA